MADERRNPRETPADEVPDRAGRGLDDMEVRQGGHSLKDREAAQVRNAQRGGAGSPVERGALEPNETLRTVWSEPGGEAYNYRNALVGAGGNADDHSDETAAESLDTTRHLSRRHAWPRRQGRDRRGDRPHALRRGALVTDRDKPPIDPERPDAAAKDSPPPSNDLPPAGPHADPALTNPDATPGTGALTPPGGHDDVDSTSG